MIFKKQKGSPNVKFIDNAARFFAKPLERANTYIHTNIQFKSFPIVSTHIYSYQVRIHESQGNETKITFPGGNILRVAGNGQSVDWNAWSQSLGLQHLHSSTIQVGNSEYTIVTLIFNETNIYIFENGKFIYTRSYPQSLDSNPSISIQHLDKDTNMCLDIGGIRTFPSLKQPSLLANDLHPFLLSYFPLKGSFTNIIDNTQVLRFIDPQVSSTDMKYIKGPFGLALDLQKSACGCILPNSSIRTSSSYSLSCWLKINTYPEDVISIIGDLTLKPTGQLHFDFLYNNQKSYESYSIESNRPISLTNWQHVLISYSYEESRLSLFINGKLDNIIYLSTEIQSRSAIIPSYGYLGTNKNLTRLDGCISDIMFFQTHLHSSSIRVLANHITSFRIAGLIALFFGVLILGSAGYIVIANQTQLQDTSSKPHPEALPEELTRIVEAIRETVGVPARPGARVSRSSLHISDSFYIHLDIGGEGPIKQGIITGFQKCINVNAQDITSNGEPNNEHYLERGAPIPYLVKVQNWATNPAYPFEDNFADYITMMGAPLTDKNVEEMSRVIKIGGTIDLWVDDSFTDNINRLASKLNAVPTYPPELNEFKHNGWEWKRTQIIAKKRDEL